MHTLLSSKIAFITSILVMFSTIIGSSFIYFFKNNSNLKYHNIFLGFTAGVMISSSIWSLLIPATQFSNNKIQNLLNITLGFLLGALFTKLLDKFISFILIKKNISIYQKNKILIILSSTVRNTIEGISIGIAFSLSGISNFSINLAGAIALSISMALQNFPEGFSISMYLKNEKNSNLKSFFLASIPGCFEPIGCLFGVFLSTKILNTLPLMLSFAAGSIILTVMEEVIPNYTSSKSKTNGTFGFIFGFILLLMLDIILK